MLLPTGAARLSLDSPEVRAAALADPAGLVAQPGPLLIDEVQHAPELLLAIKAEIDRDRTPGRFILTGSASLLRARGLSDSLAGRVLRLTLFGLSQGEIRGQRDDIVAWLAQQDSATQITRFTSAFTRSDYVTLLTTGSYPEPQSFPTRIRNAWIDSYLDGVLGRDLSDLRRQVQPDRAAGLLRLLAARQSQELVKARMAADSGIPASTIDSYLDLLRDVFVYEPLPPWTPNLAKREIGRSKVLVLDSAIAARLSRLTPGHLDALLHQEAFGQLLEGFVAAELRRQQTWSTEDYRLFHYRDSDGAEVDLIVELADGRVLAFEVKASATYQARQFHGLAALRDALGDRFIGGFVLGTATTGYRYAPRLWGLPVSALWEHGVGS
jgi:predicted AAA+ superfamily ATPase